VSSEGNNSDKTLNVSPIKRRSKISIQIEESKNKDNIEQEFSSEDDYYSDSEEYHAYDEIRNKNDEINVIKKFSIYFYFVFNQNKKYIIHICTETFNANNFHVHELIEYIVHEINNANIIIKYNNIDYSISLKDIEENDENEKFVFYSNNYEIKPYNFLTKNNTNNYCSSSLIKSIDEENIVLLSKEVLNIMILKKF